MAETVEALRSERVRVFSFTRLTQPGILNQVVVDSYCAPPIL